MRRRSSTAKKTTKTGTPTKPRQRKQNVERSAGEKHRQYDFTEGDVCLNAVDGLPPDTPTGHDLSGLSGIIYTLRDHDGELGLISNDRGELMRHCMETGLTLRTLH